MIRNTFRGYGRKATEPARDGLKDVPGGGSPCALNLPSIHRHFFGLRQPFLQAKLHGNERITAVSIL
ncbi:MAG: hypothetical protein LAO21_21235 [Acidobacteriia bacterium]|nr:hypothetical protein [Terriglobia bacterium]